MAAVYIPEGKIWHQWSPGEPTGPPLFGYLNIRFRIFRIFACYSHKIDPMIVTSFGIYLLLTFNFNYPNFPISRYPILDFFWALTMAFTILTIWFGSEFSYATSLTPWVLNSLSWISNFRIFRPKVLNFDYTIQIFNIFWIFGLSLDNKNIDDEHYLYIYFKLLSQHSQRIGPLGPRTGPLPTPEGRAVAAKRPRESFILSILFSACILNTSLILVYIFEDK